MNNQQLSVFNVIVSGLIISLSCNVMGADDLSPVSNKRIINADVWADNWFALYVNDKLVMEDTTRKNEEMSFNAETFSIHITLPAQGAVIIRDYFENDSGVEYIGRSRQQLGDGGFKAQFVDAESGQVIALSDDSWQCQAIHRAPLNKSCVDSTNPTQDCRSEIVTEPEKWKHADFDSSSWPAAVIHTEEAVRPLGGYNRIQWNANAKIIWTEDLVVDNVLLCRFTITEPK